MTSNNTTTCSNELVVENISFLFYSPFEKFIQINIVPCLAVFGVLCNLSFLLVVYRVKQFHNGINVLLVNLAIADIFFLITDVTNTLSTVISSPYQRDFSWSPVDWGCTLVNGAVHLFEASSLLFIVIISIDRYFAVCRPFQHRLSKHLRTFLFCAIPWGTAVVLAVFYSLTLEEWDICWEWKYDNATLPTTYSTCEPSQDTGPFFYVLNVAPYVISVCVNGAFYYWILKTLKRSYAVNSQRSVEARMSAVKMLVFNWLVYLVCVSPNFVLLFVNVIYDIDWLKKVEPICRALLVINSSVNPLIYNAFNSRYRKAFVRVFSFRRKTRPSRVSFSGHSSVRTTKV
ncbi:Sphingosine 1-phosphate receptor 1 [Holothuria leucospilota]|uniref:Sphingosine 1-phosphate receptor 1 n=1 Tax=Holothuria leucospilota TaxID=206669 RepID=A0A9Q1CDT6_HOLLE|nr:Sphingosine 1-phosphate receptor 1 [Holothuria leucospilota]